jgi:hypothetical protein
MQILTPTPLLDTAASWAAYVKEITSDPANCKRKINSKVIFDYYNYQQRTYLDKALSDLFSDINSLRLKRRFAVNVTKQIADAISQAYNCTVKRSISMDNKSLPLTKRGVPVKNSQDKIKSVIDDKIFHNLNQTMEQVNKWLFLDRTSLVKARWSSEKGRIIYNTYHQYEFDIVYTPNLEEEKILTAVILSDYGKPYKDTIYMVYTSNNTYRFKGETLLEQIDHNLDILPFVAVHAEDPGFEDYLEPNTQLSDGNLEINLAFSNLLELSHKQAHGILVLKTPPEEMFPGTEEAGAIESDRRLDLHDTSQMLNLPIGAGGEQPSLEYVIPQANFDGAITTIKTCLAALAQSYGAEGNIRIDATATAAPATNFWLQEKERNKVVRHYRTILEEAEKELFAETTKLAALYTGSIPSLDSGSLNIDYIDEKNVSNGNSIDEALKLYDKKVIDKIEVLREKYSTMSRAEAEEYLAEMGLDSEIKEEQSSLDSEEIKQKDSQEENK